jgi:uncharacterized protein with HEPN domain
VDIRDAITGIEGVVTGISFESFRDNWTTQRAVERGLEIISEASRHIPEPLKIAKPDIPWRQIAAIGNLLRHEYQRADTQAIWNIVQEHLPHLSQAIDDLLKEVAKVEKEDYDLWQVSKKTK